MDLVGILIFLLIGAIAGWLAGQIMKSGSFGLLGDIIVGIVGAAIASFLLPRLGISSAAVSSERSSMRPSAPAYCCLFSGWSDAAETMSRNQLYAITRFSPWPSWFWAIWSMRTGRRPRASRSRSMTTGFPFRGIENRIRFSGSPDGWKVRAGWPAPCRSSCHQDRRLQNCIPCPQRLRRAWEDAPGY